jgi:hypothetical protein
LPGQECPDAKQERMPGYQVVINLTIFYYNMVEGPEGKQCCFQEGLNVPKFNNTNFHGRMEVAEG